jgi:hypothetical protein
MNTYEVAQANAFLTSHYTELSEHLHVLSAVHGVARWAGPTSGLDVVAKKFLALVGI